MPETEDLLSQPVVIVGSARSGTTFLGDILSLHPDLWYAIEPSPIWRYKNEGKSDYLTAEDLTPEIRMYIRKRFCEYITRSGKKRLLEKTPHNSLRIPFINAVFPDAKFLHIKRDPYETILSIARYWETNTKGFKDVRIKQRLRELAPRQVLHYGRQFFRRLFGFPVLWGPIIPGMQQMLKDLSIIEVSVLQWRWCVEQAQFHGRRLGPDRYMEVRLEELDETTLLKLMQFLSLSDSTEVVEEFRKQFSVSRTAHRRNSAEPELVRMIEPWLETIDKA